MLKQNIELPKGYKPTDTEEYMSPQQLEYFRRKLHSWKEKLLISSEGTIVSLKTENWDNKDLNERASKELNASIDLRTKERYKKLITKINLALDKIDKKEYGYCQETGEKIGLQRLEARPIATLCIEAQQKHEQYEKEHVDED